MHEKTLPSDDNLVEIELEAAMLLGLKYILHIGGKAIDSLDRIRQNNTHIVVNLPDVKTLDAYRAKVDELKKLRSEV